MESCRPAIIVSFGVTAHWSPQGRQCSRNRFHGRVSCLMQFWSLTIRNTSLGPCSTGIPACVLQGLGDGDFHFLTHHLQPKCVTAQRKRGGPPFGFVWHFRLGSTNQPRPKCA